MQSIRRLRKRLQLGHRLYYRSSWVNGDFVSQRPMIIIGGCERSGTTLLRAALDSHPDVAAGPESWLFVFKPDLEFLAEEYEMPLPDLQAMKQEAGSLPEFIDRFAATHCRRERKRRWCEKSPHNILRLSYIWHHFPNARVIHIIRDGRDVVCSLRHHPKRRRVGTTYVPVTTNNPISDCAAKWVRAVTAGRAHRNDERYLELRYEDLVFDYEDTMRSLCRHCELEWDNRVLDRDEVQASKPSLEIVNPEVRQPLYASSIGKWERELSAEEMRTVRRTAGSLLDELGYTRRAFDVSIAG